MKRVLVVSIILLVSVKLFSQDFKGDYLGQTPPDNTPKLFAPGIVSSGNHDMDITISPDGNEIFFTRCGIDWYAEVLYIKRTKKGWADPVVLPFTKTRNNNYPFISSDGKTLLFESKVKSTVGDRDNREVFICNKTNKGWSDAEIMDNGINTEYPEMYTSITSSGVIYYCSNYPEGKGKFDIYKYDTNDPEAKPVNLGENINSESHEFHPFVAPDESYIIFDAFREDGYGSNDLYISFKKEDGTWTKSINMGEEINTNASDMRPFVTYDGRYLFFSSTRSNPQIDTKKEKLSLKDFEQRINHPGNGSQDIYWVSTEIIEKLKKKVM